MGIIAKMAKDALPRAEEIFGERAARDGLSGTARDILKGREEAAVAKLSQEGRDAAADVARRAATNEPAITSTLERVVADTPGAELVGKEFRLKSDDSLLRKVAGDVDGGKTASEAAGGINDAVRYTITSSPEEYSTVTSDAIAKMRSEGFEPIAMKNNWGDEGYQGINSTWRSPSGQTFEMQFHTPESFAAKEATHTIYEMERVFPKEDPIRRLLGREQNPVFGQVTRPPGARVFDFGGG
ncbi:hypothetical protein [uncultured Jatrophihabitans sp.]|uniref:hypothetical protein n=1 Tax=uncultured Jatrophihabitans sp. TaxID=1610747 RepID=UPI0035CB2313